MRAREAKDQLYEQFARTAKALASPRRIELLELLAQGEQSVDVLASRGNLSVANASAHLQVLRAARLVQTRRVGSHVFYRLADDAVAVLIVALRDVSRSRLPEVEEIVADYFRTRDALEPLSRQQLLERQRRGDVIVLDVRPHDEFAAAHIPGALSVPLPELDSQLAGLPAGQMVVAYCRGPYCVLAPQAIERLRAAGFEARRLEDGLPEWRLAGLPVEQERKTE